MEAVVQAFLFEAVIAGHVRSAPQLVEEKKIGTKRIRLGNYFEFFPANDRLEKLRPEKCRRKSLVAIQLTKWL